MGKKNVIVSAVSLGLGVLIGIMSFFVVSNPISPARLFSKLHFGTSNLTTASQTGSGQSAPVNAEVSPAQDNLVQSQNGGDANNGSASGGNPDNTASASSNPATASAPATNTTPSAGSDATPSAGSNTNSSTGSDAVPSPGSGSAVSVPVPTAPATAPAGADSASSAQVTPAAAQAIIADYKQDIGIFFDAWKSQDMKAFRAELAKGYSGALFERHARQAEGYISKGMGMEASKITFDNVTVETANADTATLRADYRYTASDYNLTDAVSVGAPSEHTVHIRVNLIKTNQRWVITGETPLNV